MTRLLTAAAAIALIGYAAYAGAGLLADAYATQRCAVAGLTTTCGSVWRPSGGAEP